MKLNLNVRDEETILIGFKLYKSIDDKIESICKSNGVNKQTILRHCVNNFLDQYNDKENT